MPITGCARLMYSSVPMSESFVTKRLASVRRLVIKVGTNLLRGPDEGLNLTLMEALAGQIMELRQDGREVILVSSGAVGAGAYELGYATPPTETSTRQALAAVGQSRLMHHYRLAFGRLGIRVAQVLLTRDSLDDRQRYLNVRNTVETLLGWQILPIVNENDTVAIEELKFGDNDQLSALIAGKVDAELLVILTDVQGIFDRPPQLAGAQRIVFLRQEDQADVDIGAGTAGAFGLGGMRSKLEAARLATRAGILTFIGPGREPAILQKVLAGAEVGTWCEPIPRRMPARKRWLALGKRPGEGRIFVDAGAEGALRAGGKSLLPSGVARVEGRFQRGELVRVFADSGRDEFAIGLTRYSAQDLAAVRGRKSREVEEILGPRDSYVVIHCDDMVVLTAEDTHA